MSANTLFSDIENLLTDIRQTKAASAQPAAPANGQAKRAEAHTETGLPPTTHPTKEVDDSTRTATEGSQTAANTASVREMVPQSVESGNSVAGLSQTEQQIQQGPRKTPTGGDATIERGFTGTTYDPGTTQPAKADDGVKYGNLSAEELAKLPFAELASYYSKQANSVLADLSNRYTAADPARHVAVANGQAAPAPQAKEAQAVAPATQQEAQQAAEAAYYANLYGCFHQIGKDAAFAAREVAAILAGEDAELRKQADDADGDGKGGEDGESKGKDGDGGKGDSGGGGSPAPAKDGPAAPPAAGGPPGGAPMGGDPSGGGAGGGDISPEEALQELLMALQEQGIPPEQAVQLLLGSIGGGDQGGPMGGGPGGSGDPAAAGGPMGGSPMGGGNSPMGAMLGAPAGGPAGGAPDPKMAKARLKHQWAESIREAVDWQKQGNFRWTEAPSGSRSRRLRDHIKQAIREVINL